MVYYSTLCYVLLCDVLFRCRLLYSTILDVLYYTTLCYAMLHCTVLVGYIVLYTLLDFNIIMLYYILRNILLYCMLYCIALFHFKSGFLCDFGLGSWGSWSGVTV